MPKLLTIISFVFCFCIAFACGKKGETTPPVVPSIKIENASQERNTTPGVMHFKVSLNKTTTVPVSVDFTTVDGSALAPGNYTAKSGTITIDAGKSTAEITVDIAADANNTRQDNLNFTLQLSNPKNVTIATPTATGTIVCENGLNFTTDNAGYSTPLTYPGYSLAWSDEFSGNALDGNFWNYEIGNGSGGWGNNELEYYTNSTKNVFVSNGNLIIEARKEPISGFNYSSARLTTQNKKTFTYGRVDIRAKLPKGKGIWPALWMLGTNISTQGWPACGEIDIMELLGHEPSKVYANLHYGTSPAAHGSKGNSMELSTGSFYDQFHVFSMIWKEDQIDILVDDKYLLSVSKANITDYPYPFNAPFFFIFNVAVGGNWPGSPDETTVFPQRMIVDYIRVFQ